MPWPVEQECTVGKVINTEAVPVIVVSYQPFIYVLLINNTVQYDQ